MHLSLDVGDAEGVVAASETVVALGGAVIKAPFETYYGAFQTVLADPEGNVVRLTTNQTALTPATAGASDV